MYIFTLFFHFPIFIAVAIAACGLRMGYLWWESDFSVVNCHGIYNCSYCIHSQRDMVTCSACIFDLFGSARRISIHTLFVGMEDVSNATLVLTKPYLRSRRTDPMTYYILVFDVPCETIVAQ